MQEQVDNVSITPGSDASAGDDVGGGSSDVSSAELQRRGDVESCPVCGSRVGVEAYHCPTCRNYFCFHCRARMLPPDTQLQCVSRTCKYYGKLVCSVCNAAAEKEDPPAVYAEPEDGYWPAWLVLVVLAALVMWYFTSFLVALLIGVAVFAGGGFLLQRKGVNVFGRERVVERHRKSTYYTCVRCRQPVKELRHA